MNKISRTEFMKLSGMGVAASIASPRAAWSRTDELEAEKDDLLLQRLIKANDLAVDHLLDQISGKSINFRSIGNEFSIITTSWCQPESRHYKSRKVLEKLNDLIDILIDLQYPDGTLDAGGNRQSPPDTSFLLDNLCPSAVLLNQQNPEESKNLKEKLNKFLLKAGEGITTGGVHTPNHRWVISSALAGLYNLYKNEKYVERIDEWLGEGVYIDNDGQFPERSRNYSVVEDSCLLNIGRLLNRPGLYDIVRKNLVTTYYMMENNGDLVTLDSRRQDQNFLVPIFRFYLAYRFLAIHYQDAFLSAVVRKIESYPNFEQAILSGSLIFFIDNPLLLNKLPESTPLPENFTKVFPLTHLVRIRRGNITASVFGGNDKPLIVASGRSTNPTFFTFRKGDAILEYARMSTSFFRTGYFSSDGLETTGNKYLLHEKKEAYYYQPLPAGKRNARGDYELSESLDRRFWSKMDFESRPVGTPLLLETSIAITEENGAFSMDIEVTGPKGVEVTLELCFRAGGELEGVVPASEKEDNFLKDGYGKYRFGNDAIQFGPGLNGHSRIGDLDGEIYTTHFGSIKGAGMHVYWTGYTPFKHTLSIK